MRDGTISARFPDYIVSRIDSMIKSGKCRNRSTAIRSLVVSGLYPLESAWDEVAEILQSIKDMQAEEEKFVQQLQDLQTHLSRATEQIMKYEKYQHLAIVKDNNKYDPPFPRPLFRCPDISYQAACDVCSWWGQRGCESER